MSRKRKLLIGAAAAVLVAAASSACIAVSQRRVAELLEELGSADQAVADAAEEQLAKYTSRVAVNRIVAEYVRLAPPGITVSVVLHSQERTRAKERVRRVLVRIGAPAARPLVAALKGDKVFWQRWIDRSRSARRRKVTPAEHAAIMALNEEIAIILMEIGEPALMPVVGALGHEDQDVHGFAGMALSEIPVKDPRAVKPLIAVLEHPDDQKRMFARHALGRAGQMAVEPLLSFLSRKTPYGRGDAAMSLGKIGDARAVEPLIALLEEDGDLPARVGAAAGLGDLGDPRAVEPLIAAFAAAQAASDEKEAHLLAPLRENAVKALGAIGDARAVETLLAVLAGDDVSLKAPAAEALGRIGDERAVGPLAASIEQTLRSGGEAIQLAAALALERIGTEEARARVDEFLARGAVRRFSDKGSLTRDANLERIARDYRDYIAAPTSEAELTLLEMALERHGDIAMAREFAKSENFYVQRVARRWADRRGRLDELPGARRQKIPLWE